MLDLILWVLAIMIFWDFSTHVIEIFDWDKNFLTSKSIFSYYYPHLSFRKTSEGPVLRENRKIRYQRFWVFYWGTAFVLTVVALVLN